MVICCLFDLSLLGELLKSHYAMSFLEMNIVVLIVNIGPYEAIAKYESEP